MAAGNWPPNFVPGPTFETPCSASDHHSYPLIPSRGTAAALFTSKLTFSCSVNLPIRSFTLAPVANQALQNGKFFVAVFLGSQAKGSRASPPQSTSRSRRKIVVKGEKMEPIWERKKECNVVAVGFGGLRSYGTDGTIYIYI